MISISGLFGCKTQTKLTEEKAESGLKLIYKPKRATYSGFEVRIIPQKPDLELHRDISVLLIDYLSKEFPDKEINIQLDSAISFVDCGQDFERVVCPDCGKEISMDFWQESMDKASKANFLDLSVTTICCYTPTDLNSLKYIADCGFAKSMIVVYDPDSKINKSKLLLELKRISGIDFKIMFAHI
ncbi:MAG: hypothetical protein IPH20_04420 [Bacteroidales bacterium]|nr:hypothetical protein [Bacteroidales bacterium]